MVPDINLEEDINLELEEEFDSLSPVESTSPPQSPARRTIEDVWSDINVSILDHPPNPTPNTNPNPFSMSDANLLDFIPPPAPLPSTVTTTTAAATPRRRNRPSRPRSATALTSNPARPNHHAAPSLGNDKTPAQEAEGERRHQRLIKNRESAARSRARKQAYSTELEKEVNRLHRDNDRLRRRKRQLEALAAAREQIPKKYGGLYRTFSGPF